MTDSTPAMPQATSITIKEMYDVSMRHTTAWGVEGYKVPRSYHDGKPEKAKFEKKKAPRALKHADYLTDTLRGAKDAPGPNQYNVMKPWVADNEKSKGPKNVGKKNSYIDLIVRQQKLYPVPGPGQYNVIKTNKEVEEDIKQLKAKSKAKAAKGAERTFFLSECEYVADKTPGPGNYHPRKPDYRHKHHMKMEPQDYRKKHTEEGKKNKKSQLPDVGSYNPIPQDRGTFAKLTEKAKNKDNVSKVKALGTSERFKKVKKDDPNNFPGPGKYGLLCTWNGKLPPGKKHDGKDSNWMNKMTKGVEKSIYYS